MDLLAWQRRALNLFGLSPVYLSTDTTPERLVLHAAEGFTLTRELAKRLAALGLRCETRSLDGGYFELVIHQAYTGG